MGAHYLSSIYGDTTGTTPRPHCIGALGRRAQVVPKGCPMVAVNPPKRSPPTAVPIAGSSGLPRSSSTYGFADEPTSSTTSNPVMASLDFQTLGLPLQTSHLLRNHNRGGNTVDVGPTQPGGNPSLPQSKLRYYYYAGEIWATHERPTALHRRGPGQPVPGFI